MKIFFLPFSLKSINILSCGLPDLRFELTQKQELKSLKVLLLRQYEPHLSNLHLELNKSISEQLAVSVVSQKMRMLFQLKKT